MISIDFATILKTIVVLILVYFIYLVRDIVFVILISIVIASAIEPAARWFARYRVSRVPAVLFVYLVAVGIIVSLFPLFVQPVLGELLTVSSTLPDRLGALSTNQLSNYFGGVSVEDLTHNFQTVFGGLSRGFVGTASFIFGGFFSFLLIVVISFYLAVQPDGVGDFLRIVVPARHEAYALDLWRRTRIKIGLWMQGQLLLGLLVGIMVYLGLVILGVNYAQMLAIVAALFELIPVFGPILSAVPAILLGFSTNLTTGFMVTGLYLIIQQFENHLLYPLVVKKIVGVPSLVVIISLIIGAQLAGFMGVLLAVPLSAVLMEFAADLESRKKLAKAA